MLSLNPFPPSYSQLTTSFFPFPSHQRTNERASERTNRSVIKHYYYFLFFLHFFLQAKAIFFQLEKVRTSKNKTKKKRISQIIILHPRSINYPPHPDRTGEHRNRHFSYPELSRTTKGKVSHFYKMQQSTLAPAPHPLQSPSAQEAANTAEQTLRAHLLPHIHSPQQQQQQQQQQVQQQVQQQQQNVTSPDNKPTDSASPDLNIDPAISGVGASGGVSSVPQSPGLTTMAIQGMSPGSQAAMEQHSGAEETQAEGSSAGRGRGGKRELSTSKRAAQNRAAQRAFRQRKEGYIKKLEEQVRDFNQMQESYKQIQAENYQLRDYIINLQSRLIEHQGEEAVPPPPLPLLGSSSSTTSAIPLPTTTTTPALPPQQQQQPPHPPLTDPSAPTANMGTVVELSSNSAANPPASNPVGAKRAHEDDAANAFLQGVAAAGNGFLQAQQVAAAAVITGTGTGAGSGGGGGGGGGGKRLKNGDESGVNGA
ncbi:unnamed protein product [Tuber melanosporum]|uniref:Putative transcription factor kapC n=2 Tax=Tuber TaxID=36048 RepID=D5GPV7_TUBMM|nr:uncharacterized protein GSTUM_00012070001 [Tuber melanosporum]CAZ86559.1 unnamed protein product [Tuber melanosporum]